MNRLKKILLVLLACFILIQFVQPAHNKSERVLPTDIASIYAVPNSVQHILKIACYDCHSNNTHYPIYAYLQPTGWFLARHIRNGKSNLNFSEFGSYSLRKQKSKLQAIANSIRDDAMPLSSYKWIHANARLSKEEKNLIIGWATKTKNNSEADKKVVNKVDKF